MPSLGVWCLPRLLTNSLAASTLFGARVSETSGHPRRWLIALRPPCWEEAQTTQRGSSQHPQGWPQPSVFGEKHIKETHPQLLSFSPGISRPTGSA